MTDRSWISRIRSDLRQGDNGNDGRPAAQQPPAAVPEQQLTATVPMEWGDYGGELPLPNSYGPMRPPMSERLVSTLVDVERLKPEDEKDLWIFKTEFVRHFQLTNYTGADILKLRRRVQWILTVHRWEAPDLANDLQIELALDLLARKSRGDLPDSMRERPMWMPNIYKYIMGGEVKPPRESAGFFGMWGRGKDKGSYP